MMIKRFAVGILVAITLATTPALAREQNDAQADQQPGGDSENQSQPLSEETASKNEPNQAGSETSGNNNNSPLEQQNGSSSLTTEGKSPELSEPSYQDIYINGGGCDSININSADKAIQVVCTNNGATNTDFPKSFNANDDTGAKLSIEYPTTISFGNLSSTSEKALYINAYEGKSRLKSSKLELPNTYEILKLTGVDAPNATLKLVAPNLKLLELQGTNIAEAVLEDFNQKSLNIATYDGNDNPNTSTLECTQDSKTFNGVTFKCEKAEEAGSSNDSVSSSLGNSADVGGSNVPSDSRSHSSSSSSASGADNAASEERGEMSTTKIVIVIVVVVVVLILSTVAYILVRKRNARSPVRSSPENDRATHLMAKEEAPPQKPSFISTDEGLSAMRIAPSELTLTKNMGNSSVWSGQYRGERVAVKRLETEMSSKEAQQTFMEQSKVLTKLSHPNVVQVLGVTWVVDADYVVVAQFMTKGSLLSYIDKQELDGTLQKKMSLDVAQGLAYLHDSARGMCMQELTSRKVLVDDMLTCKLNVFECVLTHQAKPEKAKYGTGKLPWTAPELVRGEQADPTRANVYALGMILVEVWTKQQPFAPLVAEKGRTLADLEIANRIKQGKVTGVYDVNVHMPNDVRVAIDKCVSTEPMQRPSAAEIVTYLQAASV